MSEMSIGNLYDLNKIAIMKDKKLSEEDIYKKLKEIRYFFKKIPDKHFMLLNREKYDYTIFSFCTKEIIPKKALEDFKECLQNRGNILSIEQNSENSYEIWIYNGKEPLAYYLFPYDLGVLEYGAKE